MSHREEPREVGGIYPSQQYIVVEPKKRVELTPEQRKVGKTWTFVGQPESRYLIRHEPPTTTVLKPPETYETWLPIAGPERPYVVGEHAPRKTDVTLIKAPPSVRAELREREYQQRLEAYQARRVSIGDFLNKILGVQTRLYDIEFGLREQVLIMEQRKLGFEFVEKKGGELYFIPKEKKGVAEALLGIHVPTLPEILGYSVPTPPELLGFGRMEPKHYSIMEPLAGFVAEFEQPIYTVGRITGFETPRLPPGLLSGYSLEHPAYGIGAFTGLVVQSYLIGKGVSKVTKPITTRVYAKAQTWLTKQYLKKVPSGAFIKETVPFESQYGFIKPSGAIAREFSVTSWAGLPEKIVMRLTGARPYLASGIVSYPSLETISMKGLTSQQLAWELTAVPKTSLVTITKVGAKRSVFTFTRGVGYTPMAVTLAKAMSVKEMGGRQALLLIEKPTRGKLPYLPSLIFKEPVTRLPQLFGIGLTFGLKGFPSLVSLPSPISIERVEHRKKMMPLLFPKLAPRVAPITRLKPFISPISRAKERLVPALVPTLGLVQPQIIKQVTIQKTVLRQLQTPKLSWPSPQLTKTVTIRPPRLPRFDVKIPKRKGKGLFGAWFKRTHPIKTPEEMWRTFTGKPMRIKKRKKKKGKTRKKR